MKKILIIFLFLFSLPVINASIIINEIMYNPQGVDGSHEWIEIYNGGEEDINLEDYRFFENNQNHGLNLIHGDNSIISEDEYLIIADNAETFLQDHENFPRTVLDSTFSLSNTGEYIALKNSSGSIIDEVNYSSNWGNREDYSLELKNPSLNNNEGINWNSSLEQSGTPGNINSIFAAIMEEVQFNQEIQLRYGWNLISSNVIPISAELEDIFSTLVEEGYLEIVKDSQGRFYTPRNGFNNIPEWNPYGAYWVKVNWRSNIIISGDERISTQMPLNRGWNYIAYPLNTAHSMNEIIDEVFNPLGGNLIIVKDQDGKFYLRNNNYNNIPEFIPGRGYQVKVNEETVLDFSSL